ncbi:MAG TPA: triose-phosphate isomerase [Gammaproteobacteria bacterium]|nr:triose-phosphate isomerase [Gammaproteobacteria bacterium]
MGRALVAANWKMNGSRRLAREIMDGLRAGGVDRLQARVAVCPPFVYLEQVAALAEGLPVAVGAQNLGDHEGGAYTGEVSAAMLAEAGCRYVIVGHSERRALYGEDDGTVARKFELALSAGLTPILCVGETPDEREAGRTDAVVQGQLRAVLSHAGTDAFAEAVVAYEPVWAIGSGRSASPAQAQAVHRLIRDTIAAQDATIAAALPILYGGSVKPDNAGELFAMEDIDGGLIGGASLDADDFLAICRTAG